MEETATYEFNGEIYGSTGEFLSALAHEYKVGDQQAVIDALETYGFDLADIGV